MLHITNSKLFVLFIILILCFASAHERAHLRVIRWERASVSTSEPENVDKNYVTVQTLHQYSSVQSGWTVHLSKIYRHIPEKEPEMKNWLGLFFFFTPCTLSNPICHEKKKVKYSLWQSQINGCVQKCSEQAAEEDMGSTGHREQRVDASRNTELQTCDYRLNSCCWILLYRLFTMLTVFSVLVLLVMEKFNYT